MTNRDRQVLKKLSSKLSILCIKFFFIIIMSFYKWSCAAFRLAVGNAANYMGFLIKLCKLHIRLSLPFAFESACKSGNIHIERCGAEKLAVSSSYYYPLQLSFPLTENFIIGDTEPLTNPISRDQPP